mgnify:CR=1 FL=1
MGLGNCLSIESGVVVFECKMVKAAALDFPGSAAIHFIWSYLGFPMNTYYGLGKAKAGNGKYRAMDILKSVSVTVAFLFIIGMLAGCLDEKRGRITDFEPGVYKGKPDDKLTQAQIRRLKFRVGNQSGP